MRIVLATLNAKYIHSSLALRYLRAYAKRDFSDVDLCEYTIKEPPHRIVADIYRRRPDVIGFSVYIWNVEETLPIVRMLKQVLPETKIVLGGPEVSYDTRAYMERVPEIDVIVQGEGEATFHEVLHRFEAKRDLYQVAGLVYRDNEGVHQNPPRNKLTLDDIPSPYVDEVDFHALQNRVVYFETSRGCPFSCQFCLSSIETGVRYFSLDRVTAELTKLIDGGIRTIKFVDRTFNLNREYALSLFQFLIEHRRETVFQFEITGDILPREIVDFLAENAPPGLFRFEIGIQSTNDVTNTLVKRRQNFEKLSRTILGIKAAGNIVQHLDLIAGLPEEDYASFQKTFDDVFAFEPDELQLGFLKMLRGTGLRQRARDFGYVYMDVAPYEIFYNDVLSYGDVLNIKQVEDVLEKCWNEGKARNTVRYLVRECFTSPFDFFQRFGSFWEENGWHKVGHQLEDVYLRLEAFLRAIEINTHQLNTARSWMMIDFLLQHRTRPHKVWWQDGLAKRRRQSWSMWVHQHPEAFGQPFVDLNLSLADLDKHVVIEQLPSTPEFADSPGLLVVHYPPGLTKGTKPAVYTCPLFSDLDSESIVVTNAADRAALQRQENQGTEGLDWRKPSAS